MKHFITLTLMLLLAPIMAVADFNPTAYYISKDGEEMTTTDMINDADAPLEVTFRANPKDFEGETPFYVWKIIRSIDNTQVARSQQNEDLTFTFTEAGSFNVNLYVSYGDEEEDIIGTITVSIVTSLLEVPNAFSPNGDGINDIFRVKDNHRSIVSFHAYILNRYGQQLYEWEDLDGGWDGTYKGKPVKAGVYFVMVKAKGADGRTYNIRRDVNLLRDYTEGGALNE